MRFLLLLLLSSLLTLNADGQPPEEQVIAGIDEIYLAKDSGKGEAGEATDHFISTDVPIYCVVKLASTEIADVHMKLIAVDVPGVKTETKVVSTSFKTNGKHDRVNFTGRPVGSWIPGRYRVDIFINKSLAGSKNLEIRKAAFRPKSEADAIKQRPNTKSKVAARNGAN